MTGWQMWVMQPHSSTAENVIGLVVAAGAAVLPLLGVSAVWAIKVRFDPDWVWRDWRMWMVVLFGVWWVVWYDALCVEWASRNGVGSPNVAGVVFALFAAVGPVSLAMRLDDWRRSVLRDRAKAASDVATEAVDDE